MKIATAMHDMSALRRNDPACLFGVWHTTTKSPRMIAALASDASFIH
jgi:hypothetical protein